MTVRIAAVGDVHAADDLVESYRDAFRGVDDRADVLLLAGDLTRNGGVDEAHSLARILEAAHLPVVAVLGNHDYHQGAEAVITSVLSDAGVTILEGTTCTIDVGNTSVGIAGVKGFGGGFVGACASDYGEAEMKAFVRHTKAVADDLASALGSLSSDSRIALLHYSPVAETLRGEALEIYPFLGSYLLAEAVDRTGADLVLHGHAHGGSPRGRTAGGIPVRNVAQPVIRRAYELFCLGHVDGDGCEEIAAATPAMSGG